MRSSDRFGPLIDGQSHLLIDGRWRSGTGGGQIAVEDPGKGEVVGYLSSAGEADVDSAVWAARAAFDDGRWSDLSGDDRSVLIWRLADLIEESIDEIARLDSLDMGMPLADAKAIIRGTIKTYRYYAGWADKIYGSSIEIGDSKTRFQGYTRREPVGVAALITSWNVPFNGVAVKLPAALAAGCTVVLKPSAEASLSSIALGRLTQEAGFPPGVINVVTGEGSAIGDHLVGHSGVDKVSFTGSTNVGRKVIRAASGNFARLSLELGGKSPMIVFGDADLDKAIPALAHANFWNTGQICTSGTRLLVHRSIAADVAEGVAEVGRSLNLGYGGDPATDLGPLASQKQLDTVERYVASGRRAGAQVLSGGNRVGKKGYFFEPTVLGSVTPTMDVFREEIFGPVLGVTAFDDLDEAVALANDSDYGLTASVWTRDMSLGNSVAKRLRVGKVGINVHRAGGVQMPLGGFKQSGWGRENGEEGLGAFLETKSVVTPVLS